MSQDRIRNPGDAGIAGAAPPHFIVIAPVQPPFGRLSS